jgi:hypothetical protein
MKTLIGLFLTLTTLSAFAGEITVLDRTVTSYNYSRSFAQDFEINTELGRAWLNLKFSDGNSDGPAYDEERIKIEGLSFNPTTSQIQLDVDGVQVICANVKIGRLSTRIRPTGKCSFKQKNYTVKVDDGFEVNEVEKLKITLNY